MDSKTVLASAENGKPGGHSPCVSQSSARTAKARWGKLKTTMATVNHIAGKKHRRLDRGDSFLRKFSTRNHSEVAHPPDWEEVLHHTVRRTKHRTLKSFVVHPSGGLIFYWLGTVTLAVLYNMWTCIAREAFKEIQKGYTAVWFCLDGLSDLVYICDIFVQFRTGYLQQGLMVYETSKLCKNYMKSRSFIVDVLCLLPLDFVQFQIGIHPMIRFPRFLKVYRTLRFMHMYESRTAYPNLLRVASLSHLLFLGSHWFAAFYYMISELEGFKGDWSYPKPEGQFAAVTRKYLASLYWSTLTLTTIGDLPPPDTNWQYAFVIVSYLIGVFIFATIVGQVGNVITNRNASRQEFERLLDGAKFYMQMHNVPNDLQKRVQRWYDYVWTRGRLNCNDINSLGLLPDKLKTELALHVNLGTLKKVTIFQKCRPEFLHDLMLKMRAYIFTPGDLICRRGEVAREMFIIADGVVEILGENGTVLTQMSTGDFFGEIGILNLDGGINRRTADVRSVGYSELFVLSREDVLAALKDHPDAEEMLTTYARVRLNELMAQRTPSGKKKPSVCSNDTHYCNEAFTFSDPSSSDSDGGDVFNEQEDPSKTFRNHVARKSSPCILSLPATFNHRDVRKYSCSPPLDLPIEVPPFSNFRGRSGSAHEISSILDRFMTQIMQRLELIETTNKQSRVCMQECLTQQEKLIKNIYKKLNPKEKIKDEVALFPKDLLNVNGTTNEEQLTSKESTNIQDLQPEIPVTTENDNVTYDDSHTYEDIAGTKTTDNSNVSGTARKESHVYEEYTDLLKDSKTLHNTSCTTESQVSSENELGTESKKVTVTHL